MQGKHLFVDGGHHRHGILNPAAITQIAHVIPHRITKSRYGKCKAEQILSGAIRQADAHHPVTVHTLRVDAFDLG